MMNVVVKMLKSTADPGQFCTLFYSLFAVISVFVFLSLSLCKFVYLAVVPTAFSKLLTYADM